MAAARREVPSPEVTLDFSGSARPRKGLSRPASVAQVMTATFSVLGADCDLTDSFFTLFGVALIRFVLRLTVEEGLGLRR